MSILNYVDVYPLTKDILVCIINNKREIVKINKSYIQLQPQEVSIINKLMMCRSDRYCIGDLNRYKSRLSIPLSEVHAICYRSPHNPLKKSIFFKS